MHIPQLENKGKIPPIIGQVYILIKLNHSFKLLLDLRVYKIVISVIINNHLYVFIL